MTGAIKPERVTSKRIPDQNFLNSAELARCKRLPYDSSTVVRNLHSDTLLCYRLSVAQTFWQMAPTANRGFCFSWSALVYHASNFRLGPRRSVLERLFRFTRNLLRLAGEFRIGEPLAYHVAHCQPEAQFVVHTTIVEPKRLLVHIPEQVKGFARNIGAFQTALQ